MTRTRLYRIALKMARLSQPLHGLLKGSALDPARAWTKTRDLPSIPRKSFRDHWKADMARRTNLKTAAGSTPLHVLNQ